MTIRKCPYCGSYGVEILVQYWGIYPEYWAHCPECGAGGSKMDTERDAWGAWDRVVSAIKTDEGAIATDTNVGHEIPLPVKRDERGPVSEKSVKQLLAKVYEEMSELQFAFCAVGIDIDDIGNRMLDNRPPTVPAHIRAVYDEWADVVTALTTLADALGIDADARAAAIERCNKRNQDRGRL